MNKELDEFEKILFRLEYLELNYVLGNSEEFPIPVFNVESIRKKLQRMEEIDNSNSNEALEKLDSMYRLCTPQHYYGELDNCYNTIKNYILKTQEKKVNNDIIDNYMAFKDTRGTK